MKQKKQNEEDFTRILSSNKSYLIQRKSYKRINDTLQQLRKRKLQLSNGIIEPGRQKNQSAQLTQYKKKSNYSAQACFYIDSYFIKLNQQKEKLQKSLQELSNSNNNVWLKISSIFFISHSEDFYIKDMIETQQIKFNIKYSFNKKSNDHQSKSCKIYILPAILYRQTSEMQEIFQNQQQRQGMNQNSKNYSPKNGGFLKFTSQISAIVDWAKESRIILIQNHNFVKYNNQKYQVYQILFDSYKIFSNFDIQQNNFPPIIIANSFSEVLEENILRNQCQNFTNLCKIQFSLFKAEKIYKKQHSCEFFSKLSTFYLQKIFMKKSIAGLIKFIQFYIKKKRYYKRIYFNVWAMISAQQSLQKLDNQIIDQQYCQQKYHKSLKKDSFNNWVKFWRARKRKKQQY